jgi:hypothetical protein
MVVTISPVVHGGRTRSYWTSVVLHLLSASATAAAFGAILGALGAVLGAPTSGWLVALVVIALLYLLREAAGVPIPVPQRKKQVPEWWRTFYSRPVAALLYGAGLGVGYFTYLTYGTFVAVTVGAIVSGEPITGALIVGPFGAARALALVVTGRTEPTRSTNVLEKLDSLASSSRIKVVNAVALLALTAAVALALA